MRLVGRRVPDTDLASTTGGMVNLARFTGRSVVFCYPWTGRPGVPNPPDWDAVPGAHGSTPQAIGYRDAFGLFQRNDVRVFGLSLQDSAWQREFAERSMLPFALLSDQAGQFSMSLGLPGFETGGARYLERLTLVIEDGVIARCRHPVPSPERDARELAAELAISARA